MHGIMIKTQESRLFHFNTVMTWRVSITCNRLNLYFVNIFPILQERISDSFGFLWRVASPTQIKRINSDVAASRTITTIDVKLVVFIDYLYSSKHP